MRSYAGPEDAPIHLNDVAAQSWDIGELQAIFDLGYWDGELEAEG